MRDLDTCKAEIFRRSEEKIKERSRMRRRVATLCAPLVLCLVIGAVAWPGLSSSEKSAPQGDPVIAAPDYYGGMITKNESQNGSIRLEDASAAAELLRSLGTADSSDDKTRYGLGEKHAQSLLEETEDTDPLTVVSNCQVDGSGEDSAWRITLTAPDGETEVYALQGNTLTCETGGWQRELNGEELALVQQVLGLPE